MKKSIYLLLAIVFLASGAKSQKNWSVWSVFSVSGPSIVHEGDTIQLSMYALPTPDTVWFVHPEELLTISNQYPHGKIYAAEEGYWPIYVHAIVDRQHHTRVLWVTVDDNWAGSSSHRNGIPENDQAGDPLVKAYPNPTTGTINLSTEAPGSIRTIEIISVDGRVVRTIDDPGSSLITMDLRDASKGTYFVMVTSVDGSRSRSAIVLE